MKRPTLIAAALVIVGCGLTGGEGPCTFDADVKGMGAVVPIVDSASGRATLRIGQTVEVCMFGRDGCRHLDERFEFSSDAPAVVTVVGDPAATSPGCRQLQETYAYPCCEIRVGRLTAVGPGAAHVQAVLTRAGRVEKTADFLWCPPLGPSEVGCRPVAAIDVIP